MAISNFISTVWSETLIKQLDQEYIGVKNCNRDFEGEIRGKGSTVKICSVGDITISDYTKNTDLSDPQTLSDSATNLVIDQAKSFNFQIDDVDRAQSTPKLMELAMSQAAAALAEVADKYVYSLYTGVSSDNTETVAELTEDNVVDSIISLREKLYANGVNSNIPLCLEVSPAVAMLILKAKLWTSSDNSSAMSNGALGNLVGFEVFVSPNVAVDSSGYTKCLARTKRAVAFAEQINEIEAYRPELRFADAVKGLHLYGAKIVYPKEICLLSCKTA
ncbi:MAG TPA: P22 coat protein - protein 5 domain protein [Firmicutes bacterium]|nr:P22 coat protein - protein 5 domain protein [Bacillota bacterium]